MKKRGIFLMYIFLMYILVATPVFAALHFWVKSGDSAVIEARVIESFFGGGTGTEDDPYILNQGKHLYNLSKLNSIGLMSRKYYFKMDNNLNMASYKIAPIGSYEYPFYGDLDGNGKTISNLTICSGQTDGWSEYNDIGFIGFVSKDASVYNLILNNPQITSDYYYNSTSPLVTVTEDDFDVTSIAVNNSTITITAKSGITEVFPVIQTSDDSIVKISGNTVTFLKDGTANIKVIAGAIATLNGVGVQCDKVLSEYTITANAAKVITNVIKISDSVHVSEKHIGLFAGHLEGEAYDISVFGGSITTKSKNHLSEYGLVGYVKNKEDLNLNNRNAADSGDTGYLYPDGLNDVLGKPFYEKGVKKADYYLTYGSPDVSNTSAVVQPIKSNGAIIGWTFAAKTQTPGFGIFELNVGTSVTSIKKISSSINTVRYLDGTSGGISVTLGKLDHANENANDLAKQIINPYTSQLVNQFDYGFTFAGDRKNNEQGFQVADQYTGYLASQSVTNGVLSNTISFNIAKGKTTEIIVICRSNTNNNRTIELKNLYSDGGKAVINGSWSGQSFQINSTYQATAYVFTVTSNFFTSNTTSDFKPGYNTFIIQSIQGNGTVYADVEFLYIAVGDQDAGQTVINNNPVGKIDFVYERDGQIMAVNSMYYYWSAVCFTFTTTANNTLVFSRTIADGVIVTCTGSATGFTIEGSGSGNRIINNNTS